jgi:hypothetical protein
LKPANNKKQAFFELAERFRASDDPAAAKHPGDKLGRMTLLSGFVKGHGFSRADKRPASCSPASAGRFGVDRKLQAFPQRPSKSKSHPGLEQLLQVTSAVDDTKDENFRSSNSVELEFCRR